MKNAETLQLPEEIKQRQPIVMFDGECNFCNGSVRFLISHNHSGNLSFTSLQSVTGTKILELAGKSFQNKDTLFLLQDNKIYSYSTAALKITAHLRFPWNLSGIFMLVPPIVRDAIYSYIARNRFRWFGRQNVCSINEMHHDERFI